MKEIPSETFLDMQTAVGLQTEQTFKNDFYFNREFPENLQFLETLSWNFLWSWQRDGAYFFRELDAGLWEKCEQNPRLFLKNIEGLRLWQKSTDVEYVEKLRSFASEFKSYLSKPPNSFGRIKTENTVAYFCAEYGVHNSLPIYSGGLGILAGDHLKSASDLNVPLVAVGLFYRYGYFRQKLSHDGWQEERYHDAFKSELALLPVLNQNGERILVKIRMREREVYAQAWLAQIGRISLYLLDTNVPDNDETDRLITGHLYGGNEETRIVQEKILGIGGVRLLRKLGIAPFVYHLNEGHSAFLTLELAREFLVENENLSFTDAVAFVKEKCVFTTHTPVAAGNDTFPPEFIEACFDAEYIKSLKLEKAELFALGRTNADDTKEWFGMTPLALRMSRSANGVSAKHGEVSRRLWLNMFPEGTSSEEVPITHITNGVHAPTWIAPVFQRLYEQHIGKHWTLILRNQTAWHEAVEKIPDAEIWQAHLVLKQLLIWFIRHKTYSTETGLHETINEHENTNKLFNADVLTIGFARRVAAYKRWNLLLTDLDRLLRMINDEEKPVQFVFAGKAHPQDRDAKQLLQNLMSLQNSSWQNRTVFIENYDQEVARYLVQGVDVWLNVPRRPLEASGTSGQKVAMNGGLNLSILDGWWIEGDNGDNGFSIGAADDKEETEEATIDANDVESLYHVLETQVIPAFYKQDENGLNSEWIRRMKNALVTLTPQFSSDRMVKDYIEQIYCP
ncbi:MAG: alpha-glucan family phosphorylase [Acidobacteriota bacterium]|nr:alpha-glucan family phosphorylase [Acidobacteriota bacterium]